MNSMARLTAAVRPIFHPGLYGNRNGLSIVFRRGPSSRGFHRTRRAVTSGNVDRRIGSAIDIVPCRCPSRLCSDIGPGRSLYPARALQDRRLGVRIDIGEDRLKPEGHAGLIGTH
jgi:hypothetical protein